MQNLQENELELLKKCMLYVKTQELDIGEQSLFDTLLGKIQKEIDEIEWETQQKRRAEAEDAARSELEND